MNAIQIWVTFCIVMVFLALLEYGLILWIKFSHINGLPKYHQMQRRSDSACSENTTSTKIKHTYKSNWTENNMQSDQKSNICTDQSKPQNRISRERMIDKISIIVFPLSFVVFNIMYWFMYL